MSSENPFNDAMDEAEAQSKEQTSATEFETDEFLEVLDEGKKTETIGVAVTEEMHAVYRELRNDDSIDVDVAESIRQHLANLAQRHPQAAERAGRKLQIDRELSE
jgi:predicted DsbA family dithiol-disulfide isomerase